MKSRTILSAIIVVEAVNFPQPQQLTEEELDLVCKAFDHLLFTWNSGIDLPEKFPMAWRYKFMVDTLNQGITIVNSGFMTFDYCTGYAPDCVFEEFCPCLDVWKDWKEDDNDATGLSVEELPY